MITKAEREQVFYLLSSKLDEKDAIHLEKQITQFFTEKYIQILESKKRGHLQGWEDRKSKRKVYKDNFINTGMESHYMGEDSIFKIRDARYSEEIAKEKDELIKILKE